MILESAFLILTFQIHSFSDSSDFRTTEGLSISALIHRIFRSPFTVLIGIVDNFSIQVIVLTRLEGLSSMKIVLNVKASSLPSQATVQ